MPWSSDDVRPETRVLAHRIGLAFTVWLVVVATAAATEPEIPGPALGLALSGESIPDALASIDASHPIEVRVIAEWATIESSPGTFDWSSVEPVVSTLASRGVRVVLCVRGESPLHGREASPGAMPDGSWLQAWTALLRSAVATLGGRVAVVEVGEHPERAFDPVAYAFVLKSSSLAIRAEAKANGIDVRVAQGAVDVDGLTWQKALWDNDTAPYIDVLPVAFAAGADVASGVAGFAAEAALHPPAAALRADVAVDEADTWSSFRGAVGALASSAPAALVSLPTDGASAETVSRVVAGLQSRLAVEYAPAPLGGLALRTPEGGTTDGAVVLGRFLHAKDFATLVVYQAPPSGVPDDQSRLLLDTIDVKDPAVVDLLSGASYKTGPASVPDEKRRALRLLLADHPMAVVWERAAENQPGLDVAAEDVDVATTRGLTAEEIIAKNRQVQKIQDDKLLRWIAKGRADIHFKLAQGGGSIDVAIESTYFWRRGAQLEWQQTKYYVNGNRVTWKRIPELPLIQPEKVVTLPLDLTFDKTYDYKLAGEDSVEGRAAYIVAFEPTAELAAKSLYRGRVWIDKESFVRLRTSVLQTHLEAPILQNEETDLYRAVPGAPGESYVLIGSTDGQQLWSGGGRNFVVRRELAFSDFNVNPTEEAFDQTLKEAYASDDQMLRDTDAGFRYLEKKPGGEREVRSTLKTDALFALAGALKDDSTDGVLPALGVNWFDYDLLKKKIQINVFFAGVYAFVNLTDPSLGGTKIDLGAEASLVGIKFDDKFFVDGVEDVSQRIRRRSQYLTGRVGFPLGNFFKLSVIGDFAWNTYDDSSDASAALASENHAFVLPVEHEVYAGTLQFEFNRTGYSITASGTASRRSKWERWGLFDIPSSTFVDTTFDPNQKSFTSWKLTAFKEWYLPKFQKLKAEIDYLDGKNLDRFSQYVIGRFGDESLEGFAGTGVRFDTGAIARAGWAFNIASLVRFDVSAEYGRVRDSLEDDRFRNHTGVGLSFNIPVPWTMILQGSYGRAIASDVPGLKGKQEFQILLLKLFPRGPKSDRSR
jgi:hypothetical protein